RAQLRRARTMIPLNDIWIAATALAIGANPVTHDNRFQHVKNLVTVDWTLP
ncbi:MAG: type II toxin-antitoxin system VapC family toxin, partial [Chthonomonadaceae bacterium]|nr:type II toxin-antitoxin system VapC family toxin [Chthonomonadaceae bacterium]